MWTSTEGTPVTIYEVDVFDRERTELSQWAACEECGDVQQVIDQHWPGLCGPCYSRLYED